MASLQASSPGVREPVKGHPLNYLDFGRVVLAESSRMCTREHSVCMYVCMYDRKLYDALTLLCINGKLMGVVRSDHRSFLMSFTDNTHKTREG